MYALSGPQAAQQIASNMRALSVNDVYAATSIFGIRAGKKTKGMGGGKPQNLPGARDGTPATLGMSPENAFTHAIKYLKGQSYK